MNRLYLIVVLILMSGDGICDGMVDSDEHPASEVEVYNPWPSLFQNDSVTSVRVAFLVSTEKGNDDLICLPLPKPPTPPPPEEKEGDK